MLNSGRPGRLYQNASGQGGMRAAIFFRPSGASMCVPVSFIFGPEMRRRVRICNAVGKVHASGAFQMRRPRVQVAAQGMPQPPSLDMGTAYVQDGESSRFLCLNAVHEAPKPRKGIGLLWNVPCHCFSPFGGICVLQMRLSPNEAKGHAKDE